MKRIAMAALFVLSSVVVTAAPAQEQTFAVNPQASQLAFTLGDVLHTVHGTFHVQSGAVEFDPRTHAISGSIIVATGSGNSGSGSRDRKMKKEILDVPQFALGNLCTSSASLA
jgi:polyisoprenoid-binding protein YceI